MDNWYYFYDKRGFDTNDLKELSLKLENLGYKYNQPSGLGAGPSPEQIILWIHNNQFLSGVSIGILSNYFYDVLKSICFWFKTHKSRSKAIPIVEIFLTFKDIKNDRTSANLKFRIDQGLNKKDLKDSLEIQMKILRSSSEEGSTCFYCNTTVFKHAGFYLKRDDNSKAICQDCIDKIK